VGPRARANFRLVLQDRGRGPAASGFLETSVRSHGAAPSITAVRTLVAQARLRHPGDPIQPSSEPAGLTAREYEVLQLLVVGQTNDKIGKTLYVSPRTVSVHVTHILRKLGARNRTEVAAIADQKGLIAR
jgi:DNA-binding NarL/FixJ family response regulator